MTFWERTMKSEDDRQDSDVIGKLEGGMND